MNAMWTKWDYYFYGLIILVVSFGALGMFTWILWEDGWKMDK